MCQTVWIQILNRGPNQILPLLMIHMLHALFPNFQWYFFQVLIEHCKQTVKTQIRHRIVPCLIWVCTVCLSPIERMLDLYITWVEVLFLQLGFGAFSRCIAVQVLFNIPISVCLFYCPVNSCPAEPTTYHMF